MKLDLESYTSQRKIPDITGKYIDRELSWLKFNERVLSCASDPSVPLNERFKFLAISNSNLDEFISVRYSSTFTTDEKLAKKVRHGIKYQMDLQREIFQSLCNKLQKSASVQICKVKDLNKSEKELMHKIYRTDIFPLLTPVSVGMSADIPNLYNGQSAIALIVLNGRLENLIIIPIPKCLKKLWFIGRNKAVFIEDIILANLKDLCVNKQVESFGYFRIVKDFSICLNHDTRKFILDRMSSTIIQRDTGPSLFLQVDANMDKELKHILMSLLDISKKNVYDKSQVLDYTRFMKPILGEEFSYKPFEAFQFEIGGQHHNIFSVLKEQDILLHHPYDSYNTIITFLEHAAHDPMVLSIKQTLYRVSSEDSPIVNALCDAAKLGKSVTALIEIKARFDETQNIALIDKLKRSGVNVVLGFENLKTHCKMCLVVRKESSDLKVYSHIATGNYNEKTATQYTDLSYLTSKQKIGNDLLDIFNILSGISTPDDNLQRVFYAPINLRKRLIKNIDREISHAKKGKKAEIFLKMNSINDPEIINKLYEAANKGVEISIICRGICSIIPQKNLQIKSIVGRFLEHSRIYYFRNAGNGEFYISSADLLTRNLDKRVEILFLVTDPQSIRKLKHIRDAFKADQRNSYVMNDAGEYKKSSGSFDCHQWFITKSSSKLKLGKK